MCMVTMLQVPNNILLAVFEQQLLKALQGSKMKVSMRVPPMNKVTE